ncbi:DUF6528 family protein [Thermomonospora umbrina]|uniref:WD40 repeat protein n=1 Tax=Thermomonospora umbrina TaxID=111806 RepID=A0A3D9SI96_9ACTN|nr:DUF6528 family protein [Thermomonospora umbrina]REE95648.1 hypothetical protein DFJ69_1057 [Thermomonospora umbrina]
MLRRALRRLTLAAGAAITTAVTIAAPAGASPAALSPAPPTDPVPGHLRHALAHPPGHPTGWAHGLVIGGDQGGDRIVVMDSRRRDWTQGVDPRAQVWSWAPTADNGYADAVPGWGAVSDVRVRTAGRRTFVLTGDSWGFIGAVEYPSGRRLWAVNAGRAGNVHAAELLPDGNVAAAASTGGWIRVYAASQGPTATAYTEFRLKGGHGVLWDPRREVLWAIGDDHLVALRVGGTPSAPTLTEVYREDLPSHGGHDLAPVQSDRDRLWITTNTGVYQYDKTTGDFTTDFRHTDSVAETPLVKAIGDHPATGQLLLTRPKQGCATTWCTDTAEFFGQGPMNATRTLPTAQFYKARWFAPTYQ